MPSDSSPPFPPPPGMRWDAERRRFFKPDDSTARIASAPQTSKRAAPTSYRWQFDGEDEAESSSAAQQREERKPQLPVLARNSLSSARRGAYGGAASSIGASMAQRRSNVAYFAGNLMQSSYAFVGKEALGKLKGIATDPSSPDVLWTHYYGHVGRESRTPDRVDRLHLSDRIPIDQERKPYDHSDLYDIDIVCERAVRTDPIIDTSQTSCPDCMSCVDEGGLGGQRFVVDKGLGVLVLGSAVHLAFLGAASFKDPYEENDFTGHFNYHPCLSFEDDPSGRSHYARATQSGITAVAINHQIGSEGRGWRSVMIAVALGKYIQLAIVREEPDRGGLGICEHFNTHDVQDHPHEGLFEGGMLVLKSQCVALQISKDGRTLYAGLRNGNLLVLQTDQLALLRQPTRLEKLPRASMHRLVETDMCMTICAVVSENELLLGWLNGELRLVDAREPDRCIRRFVGHCAREVPNVPFAIDSELRLFAVAGEDLAIRIFSLDESVPVLKPKRAVSGSRKVRASNLLPGLMLGQHCFLGAEAPHSLRGHFGEMPAGLAFCRWTEARGREKFAPRDTPEARQRPGPFMLAVACPSNPVVSWYC